MATRGRPPRISDAERDELIAIVKANPTTTLEEIGQELVRRTGVAAHAQTIEKALRAVGFERRQDGSTAHVDQASVKEDRYGYSAAHHRRQPEQMCPSCLTDAEWALVAHVFDNSGGRGTPPKYSRRLPLDATERHRLRTHRHRPFPADGPNGRAARGGFRPAESR